MRVRRERGQVLGALFAAAFAAGLVAASPASAQELLAAAPGTPIPAPPPVDIPYLQYGVAFTSEFVTSAGKMCSSTTEPCILGSGGGVVARLGRRSAGPWYFGGAYEMSKQDPASLYRFATLQQLRIEARYYLNTGRDVYPYATFGGGLAAYGNEWGIDTYGFVTTLGVGLEAQISRRTVVGFALSYRLLGLRNFLDSSGFERDASVIQIVGIDITMEERNPIASALPRK
jgi:hypothetical protein